MFSASLIILVPLLLIAAMFVGGHVIRHRLSADAAAADAHPDRGFEQIGAVHTRFGDAQIGCGGTLTNSCAGQVGLRFAEQTPQLIAYFTPRSTAQLLDPASFDRLARAIAGPPPPHTQWVAMEAPGMAWNSVLDVSGFWPAIL
jgi:hypothetical protein